MNPPLVLPGSDETQEMLRAVLREVRGPGAKLEVWAAQRLTKRGKCRVVQYQVQARVAGAPAHQRYQWVGKLY